MAGLARCAEEGSSFLLDAARHLRRAAMASLFLASSIISADHGYPPRCDMEFRAQTGKVFTT